MTKNAAVPFIVFATIAVSAFGGLEVETAPDYPEAVTTLAVAPLDCEKDLACEKIEQALMDDILALFDLRTVRIITPEEIQQELAVNEAQTGSPNERILAIARRFGCDAVLMARVRSSGGLDDTLATNEYQIGVSNSIEILDREGRILMRGWASFPAHPWQQNTANFAKAHFNATTGFEQILARSVE